MSSQALTAVSLGAVIQLKDTTGSFTVLKVDSETGVVQLQEPHSAQTRFVFMEDVVMPRECNPTASTAPAAVASPTVSTTPISDPAPPATTTPTTAATEWCEYDSVFGLVPARQLQQWRQGEAATLQQLEASKAKPAPPLPPVRQPRRRAPPQQSRATPPSPAPAPAPAPTPTSRVQAVHLHTEPAEETAGRMSMLLPSASTNGVAAQVTSETATPTSTTPATHAHTVTSKLVTVKPTIPATAATAGTSSKPSPAREPAKAPSTITAAPLTLPQGAVASAQAAATKAVGAAASGLPPTHASATATATGASSTRSTSNGRRRRGKRSHADTGTATSNGNTANSTVTPPAPPPPPQPKAPRKPRKAKNVSVRFGQVHVRQYERQLGGSGGVPSSGGWSLGLGAPLRAGGAAASSVSTAAAANSTTSRNKSRSQRRKASRSRTRSSSSASDDGRDSEQSNGHNQRLNNSHGTAAATAGTGKVVESKYSLDGYETQRQQRLHARFKDLTHKQQRMVAVAPAGGAATAAAGASKASVAAPAELESRQYTHKRGTNPLFRPLDQDERRQLLESESNVPSRSAHDELDSVSRLRESRSTNSGCSCRYIAHPNKLSVRKLVHELRSRGDMVNGNAKKASLVARLTRLQAHGVCRLDDGESDDVDTASGSGAGGGAGVGEPPLPPPPPRTRRRSRSRSSSGVLMCECAAAGVACHSELCGCCATRDAAGKHQCHNPAGLSEFLSSDVKHHVAAVLRRVAPSTKALTVHDS